MKQTAVEILEISLLGIVSFDSEVLRNKYKELLKIAKEMEKENTINAYVTGIIEPLIMKNYKGLSVDEIKVDITKQAEEYYNEIFKNETR